MKNKLLPHLVIALVSILFVVLAFKEPAGFSRATGSPFELSNSTARFALVEAIVENHTLFLNNEQAQFASPDVVFFQGKFLSIFTPGISFLAVPFYFVGKAIGQIQPVTYLVNSIFLVLNIFLVAKLASRFRASKFAAILCGVVFAFGTNALPYSQTLTQHLVSASILLGMIICVKERMDIFDFLTIGLLFGFGTIVDFPNALMGLPVILFLAFSSVKWEQGHKPNINFRIVFLGIGMIPVTIAFCYYNFVTTGSFLKLAQSIGRTDKFSDNLPVTKKEGARGEPIVPFSTRNQINGLYILALSDERSWIYYSPAVLLGILGLLLAAKNKKTRTTAVLSISVCAVDYFVYSSFGDPWGGWAFGPRYLIPAAAISSAGLGFLFGLHGKKPLFLGLLTLLILIGVWVNSLGALTTNAIPPKIEAVNLIEPIPHTPKYNVEKLSGSLNTSWIYKTFLATRISPMNYWFSYAVLLSAFIVLLGLAVWKEGKHEV